MEHEAPIGPLGRPGIGDGLARCAEVARPRLAEEGGDLRCRCGGLVGRAGSPRRCRERDPPAPRHRRLVVRTCPGIVEAVPRLDIHEDERIEHHRPSALAQAHDRLHDRGVGRRASEDRPAVEAADHRRARAVLARHHPRHAVPILDSLLDRRPEPAAVAAQVVPEPGRDQRHRLDAGQFRRHLIERGDEIRQPAVVVDIGDRALARAAPKTDRVRRERVLAGPGHQRNAPDVERRRPRLPCSRGRPPEDLDVELRNAVAVRGQVEIFEHEIGGSAKRRCVALDRRDERIGELILGSLMQPEGQGRLVHRLPVGPNPPDPRDLALAEGNREAHRIAELANGGAATALAADVLRLNRLEEPARPDDLTGHPAASEDPRQHRAFARRHDPEPLDLARLHGRGAGAEDALVDRRPEQRAGRLAERHRAQPGHRAAEGTAKRSPGRREQEGCHHVLRGKR